MDYEKLRQLAYSRLVIEKYDYKRIDKIVDGIQKGKITKDNLYTEVRRMCATVKTDHTVKRWQCIADWFANNNWY